MAKLPKGITQIAPKLYVLRVIYKDPRTGNQKEVKKRHRGSLESAVEARSRLKQELLDPSPGRVQLAEYAISWMTTKLLTIAKPTARKYANDLDNHLIPKFGDFYLDAITLGEVRRYVADSLADGMAGYTIKNKVSLLRNLMNEAKADGYQTADLSGRITIPVNEYDEDDPNLLEPEQLDALLGYVHEHETYWAALITTQALTGLRWGEVSALRWDDLDHDRGLLHVRRRNWRGHEGRPKTKKSRRSAPLGPELASVLREHRLRMVADQHPGLANGWLFPTQAGTLHKGYPLLRVLQRSLSGAGIDIHVTSHGLRRTFNNIVRQIVDRLVVQSMTGHVTDAMTDHYSIVRPTEKLAAQAGLLRLLPRASGTFTGNSDLSSVPGSRKTE